MGPAVGAGLAQVGGIVALAAVRAAFQGLRTRWFPYVEEGLQREGLVGELGRDDVAAAVLDATTAAARTQQEEKLAALRNAVLNVAARSAPDAELRHIFFNLIDRLTASHLRALRVCQDPFVGASRLGIAPPTSPRAITLAELIQRAFPEISGVLADQVARDLVDAGLVSVVRDYDGNAVIDQRSSSWTTKTGNQLLDFVTRPAIPD